MMKIAKVGTVKINMAAETIDIMDYEFLGSDEQTPTQCIKCLILEKAIKILNNIMTKLQKESK